MRIGVPQETSASTHDCEVIALKIRTIAADDAVREALAALKWLQEAGAEHVVWKYCSTFDSTATGNIGPVAEALMNALDTRQTIYCPAFPENGRTVYQGNLFVAGQPLSESPMRDHPLTPMGDSNLVRSLEPQVKLPVGLLPHEDVKGGVERIRHRLETLLEQRVAHVVVDAIDDDDLMTISEACRDFPLITGGSAIALPACKEWTQDRERLSSTNVRPPFSIKNEAIILSGSCSIRTLKQIDDFLGNGPALQLHPVDLVKNGIEPTLNWLAENMETGDVPVIYASAEPERVKQAQMELGIAEAGKVVEDALAACAVAARGLGKRRFIIAGGETSGAVTKALGVETLEVGPEIAPGVPWCFAQSDGHTVALALKSGNFGAPSFFQDALAALPKS